MKKLLPLAFAALLLSSCVSVEYTGKSFPATSEVKVFKDKSEVPAGYKVVGRAAAHADAEDFSRDDVQAKLVEKARSVGADAMLITCFEKLRASSIRVGELTGNRAGGEDWNLLDTDSAGDWDRENRDLSPTSDRKDAQTPLFKILMKAVFLKKIEAAEPSGK